MMKFVSSLAVTLFLLLGSANAAIAECTPIHEEFLRWGMIGATTVETDPVPAGEVWVVTAAGVFGNNFPGEYMMEINHPVWSQGGACCWRIPVARTTGFVTGTPYLALSRELTLREGDTLTGRVNGLQPGAKIGVTMLYDVFSEACVP